MTTVQAQQMVGNARAYLSMQRSDGRFGDCFKGDEDYREAWQILFAAENLLSDPAQPHYQKVLRVPVEHSKDSDCTVDPETMLCTVCGVDHSESCPVCDGHGFHAVDCIESDANWQGPLTEFQATASQAVR